jgi:hypothetical protein
MRRSTALLAHTPVRLAELRFPHGYVHVRRTRLVFIHLDNLLHFAKIDRDGHIDGYILAYLPKEVIGLLLIGGEVASALAYTEEGRAVMPIATALRRIRKEPERGELVFCDASREQLAWMYGSCAAPAIPRPLATERPEDLLPMLQQEAYTGLLELIANGRVNYVRLQEGECVAGCFHEPADGLSATEGARRIFAPDAGGRAPAVAAAVFPTYADIPAQAPPALLQIYRELFWAIAGKVEQSAPNVGLKRAYRLRESLATIHASLTAIGRPLDREAAEIIDTQEQLTFALSDWALQLLEELEVIAPGVAAGVLKEATKEHRFLLQKAGFYTRLPWTVDW